jgi:hypothetical protein
VVRRQQKDGQVLRLLPWREVAPESGGANLAAFRQGLSETGYVEGQNLEDPSPLHRVPGEQVRLLTPLEDLTLYTWNTHTARDYFCPNFGILPFRRPPTARAGEWGINVRCLEDIDSDAIPIKRVFGSRLS